MAQYQVRHQTDKTCGYCCHYDCSVFEDSFGPYTEELVPRVTMVMSDISQKLVRTMCLKALRAFLVVKTLREWEEN